MQLESRHDCAPRRRRGRSRWASWISAGRRSTPAASCRSSAWPPAPVRAAAPSSRNRWPFACSYHLRGLKTPCTAKAQGLPVVDAIPSDPRGQPDLSQLDHLSPVTKPSTIVLAQRQIHNCSLFAGNAGQSGPKAWIEVDPAAPWALALIFLRFLWPRRPKADPLPRLDRRLWAVLSHTPRLSPVHDRARLHGPRSSPTSRHRQDHRPLRDPLATTRSGPDIEETQGHAPNYPIIGDADFNVQALGMLPRTQRDPRARPPTIRRSATSSSSAPTRRSN